MAMVSPNMPGFGHPQPDQGKTDARPSLDKLGKIEKVAMVRDNTCCEKQKQCMCPCLTTCCCPIRFKITNADHGYEIGSQHLYTVEETRCCCPNQWTLFNTAREKVNVYTAGGCRCPCLALCFGGFRFDVNDMIDGEKGTHHGAARMPKCQCFDTGYNIEDTNKNPMWFVGNVCRCCDKDMNFEPVWNHDKTELETMNVYVRPCMKKYIPCWCFGKNYWILDFPTKAEANRKSEFVAGKLI